MTLREMAAQMKELSVTAGASHGDAQKLEAIQIEFAQAVAEALEPKSKSKSKNDVDSDD